MTSLDISSLNIKTVIHVLDQVTVYVILKYHVWTEEETIQKILFWQNGANLQNTWHFIY